MKSNSVDEQGIVQNMRLRGFRSELGLLGLGWMDTRRQAALLGKQSVPVLVLWVLCACSTPRAFNGQKSLQAELQGDIGTI